MSVAVSGGLQNLVGKFLDSFYRQLSVDGPHVLLEVVLTVFENEVQVVLLIDDFLKTKGTKVVRIFRILIY